MKKIYTIALTIMALSLCAVSFGQNRNNGRDWQTRMKAEKIAFLTNAMDLTPAEAERFWPVYNMAESERREAWEHLFSAFKQLKDGIDAGKDDKEISALLDKYLQAEQANQGIDRKYVSEYRKILPNKKIAKLFLGEEDFRRMQIHKLNKNDNSKNDKR